MIIPAETVRVTFDEIGVTSTTEDPPDVELSTEDPEIETDEIGVTLVPRGVNR